MSKENQDRSKKKTNKLLRKMARLMHKHQFAGAIFLQGDNNVATHICDGIHPEAMRLMMKAFKERQMLTGESALEKLFKNIKNAPQMEGD